MTKFYTADFETTVKEPVEVWLAGFQPVDNYIDLTSIKTQTNIKDFSKNYILSASKKIQLQKKMNL